MKANLRLEIIGLRDRQAVESFDRLCDRVGIISDREWRTLPWVAAVYQYDSGYKQVTYLHGKRDYSRANSRGTRGVYENFTLDQNVLYRVAERVSWKSSREYWVAVTPDGGLYELTDEEALEWLNNT